VSDTLNQYTLTGAIVGADEFLGPDRVWVPRNDFQRALIEGHFAGPKGDLAALEKLDLMESKASRDADVLNEILQRRGFSIQLDEFADDEFGVVSILEMLVGWLAKGRRAKLDIGGTEYDAAHLMDAARVRFYRAARDGAELDIAAVPAVFGLDHQDADDENASPPSPDVTVYMTRLDNAPAGFDLIDMTMAVQSAMTPIADYKGLIFPMVNLDHKPDIGALRGMSTTDENGQGWEISQALQQNLLKMNHKGALAKSATAIGCRITSVQRPRPPLVIDGPFLVWFAIDGMSEPLFVAHVTEDDFEDPGDLA